MRIESALTRPQNLFVYGQPGLFDLAAAYTAGLSQNHGFVDGNKRTGFLTAPSSWPTDYDVMAEQAEVIAAMLELADHQLDEAGYGLWLRDHTVPV